MLLFFAIVCISCGGGGIVPPKATEPESVSSETKKKFTGKRYALLVGIRKYDSKDEFPDLMYSEKDVEDLALAMGKAGYTDSNIVLMTGVRGEKNTALKPEPRNVPRQTVPACGKVYGRGRAVRRLRGPRLPETGPRRSRGRSILLLRGAMQEGRDKALIDIDEVYKILRDSRAGLKVVVMDACRNSATRAAPPPMKPGFSSVTVGSVPPGVMAFFSCSEGQRSYESDKLENGVFFHFVIEAFQGKANTSNGQLTRFALGEYLDQNVDRYVQDVLKLDKHQALGLQRRNQHVAPVGGCSREGEGESNAPSGREDN